MYILYILYFVLPMAGHWPASLVRSPVRNNGYIPMHVYCNVYYIVMCILHCMILVFYIVAQYIDAYMVS